MASPAPFNDKDDLVAEVLQYYRAHTHELSGPTAACHALWPALMRRTPAALRNELALIGLAHLVQRYATQGSSPDKGWDASLTTLPVTRLTADGSPGETIDIPVERVVFNGPTEIYPAILVNTIYTTPDGAKPLILFTLHDFRFVDQHLEAQQYGLARRQAALRYGARLLRQHGAETVAALPAELITLFEGRWTEASQPPKSKKKVAAA
jgi:hypothetical protein